MSFPASPTTGDISRQGVITYRWDGSEWVKVHLYLPDSSPSIGTDTAGSDRGLVAAITCDPSTAHTKSAWTQAIASTSAACDTVIVGLAANTASSAVNTSTLIDIGTGGAGSETVVAANIPVGFRQVAAAGNQGVVHLPLHIASGTRVAVRAQSAMLSQSVTVRLGLTNSAPGHTSPTTIYDLCANTATSRGVDLTVPGSLNTKGNWVDLVASTATRDYAGLICGLQAAGSSNLPNGKALVDIGIGGSGNSVTSIIAADIPVATSSTESFAPVFPALCTFIQHVPTGSRLAGRFARTSTVTIDVVLHGIPYT